MDTSAFDLWLNRAKDIVEIAALCVAAAWAYFRFVRTDEPTRTQNFLWQGSFSWVDLGLADRCLAELELQLRNNSTRTIDVTKVILKAWYFNLPDDERDIQYFDPNWYVAESAAFLSGFERESDQLRYTYPPGYQTTETFHWIIKKSDEYSYVCFKVELYANGVDSLLADYYHHWERVCGMEENTPQSVSAETLEVRERPTGESA